MTRPWATCHSCGKSFVPRFSYQSEAASDGGTRHFCSIACRTPELSGARPSGEGAQHECAVCKTRFTMQLAYQVVTVGKQRNVVCSEACRAHLLEAQRPPAAANTEARVIAVLNQKGGTGKTTTSVSVAAGLAERGYRTLLIDVDAQGNVGVSLGVKGQKGLYHVLVDGRSPSEVAVPVRKHLDVITADQTLAAAELELVNAPGRAEMLAKRMQNVAESYDYVILDCAPSLSLLNQNALVYARSVLVPVSCDYLSLVGVKQILRTLEHVRKALLIPVEIAGVLPTLYDKRNNISKQSVSALEAYFGDKVLPPIRVDVRLKEAPSHKKTIFEYAPESNGARDYAKVVERLVAPEASAEAPRPAEVAVVTAEARYAPDGQLGGAQ